MAEKKIGKRRTAALTHCVGGHVSSTYVLLDGIDAQVRNEEKY